MEAVLQGLQWTICLVYLDDIIIFSRDFKTHIEDIRNVLQRLKEVNIKCKPSKCHFALKEVEYLGHIVSSEGVKPDPNKVKVITKCPTPKTQKQLKSFLGLAGYYRRFVKDYSQKALPLYKLLRKNAKFDWKDQYQEAFEILKELLTTHPILAYPNFTLSFKLYVDASGFALRYVLGQDQKGTERVIAYGGRVLKPAEKNYSATEKEALAVVEAVKFFYSYLYGNKFVIYTDHHSL